MGKRVWCDSGSRRDVVCPKPAHGSLDLIRSSTRSEKGCEGVAQKVARGRRKREVNGLGSTAPSTRDLFAPQASSAMHPDPLPKVQAAAAHLHCCYLLVLVLPFHLIALHSVGTFPVCKIERFAFPLLN